jgi:hypothetical protein
MKRGGIEHRQLKLRLIPEKALGGALSPVALRRSLLHPALNASPFEPNVHLSVSGAGGTTTRFSTSRYHMHVRITPLPPI